MSDSLTINPAHLSDDDWVSIRTFLSAAKDRGEVVEFSSHVVLLTPADVARRLGMSRSTVLRRIADGDLKATKVGTHHRIPLAEFERYSHELMRRMAEADRGRHRGRAPRPVSRTSPVATSEPTYRRSTPRASLSGSGWWRGLLLVQLGRGRLPKRPGRPTRGGGLAIPGRPHCRWWGRRSRWWRCVGTGGRR